MLRKERKGEERTLTIIYGMGVINFPYFILHFFILSTFLLSDKNVGKKMVISNNRKFICLAISILGGQTESKTWFGC